MRHTGIPMIGDVPWGTHFCQFYQDKQDLVDILVPYFKAGLENNEFCMWVTSEPLRAQDAKAALARCVPDLERYIRNEQIEILDYSDWYTVGGKFESDRVLQGWVQRLEAALERGFEGLRLTGNTFWLEKSDWQDFKEYEAAVDSVIGQYRLLAMCTYSLARCGAVEIMDVVSNHAFALVKRAGKWQIVESPERKRIEASRREGDHAQSLLAAIVESSTDAIIGNGLDGTIQTWNGGAERMFGFSCLEAVGQHISLIVPPDLRDQFDSLMQDALRGDLIQDHETVRLTRDGSRIEIALTLSPIRDRFGDVVGMSSIAREIARRKEVEEALREQREWLRVTLTSIGDAVLAIDLSRRITFINPVGAELTGWTEQEAIGRRVDEVFRITNEESRLEAEDIVAQVMREGKAVMLANHMALVTRDGREIPIEDSAAPITDSTGKVTGAVVVFHDVTEKRRAEEALRQSERRVRLKLESILSPQGDLQNLELGDVIDVEVMQSLFEDFYKLAGIPMAIIDLKGKVLVGVGWQDVCVKFHRVQPESCKHCIESDTELTAGVPAGTFKLYKCKNNLWDMATPLMLGGEHVGNVFTGQFFLKEEPVDYGVFRLQAAKYGFPEEKYFAALEAVPRLSRDDVNTAMAFLTKLGQLISILSYSNLKLARSVAERDALTASLSRAQEIAHLGSWELDLVSRRLSWSDEVYRIFGFEPQEFGATYAAFLEAVHPDDRRAVDAAYTTSLREGKGAYDIEHRVVRRRTGEVRWVYEKCEHLRDGSGAVVRSIGMVQDITDRKRSEEHLREAQRLESIGLLAGGIAHDFNNLLVGVMGNASLARELLPPDDSDAAELLNGVIRTGEELAHLTRQMLAYSGKGRFVIEPLDLSKLITEFSTLVQPSISKKVALKLDLRDDLPAVEADRSQVQQVYMNLVINAAEAIGSSAGLITVRTGVQSVDEQYQRYNPDLPVLHAGEYVFLEVRDTGCGMDDATKAKVFEPFFSTKFLGRGLGLAAVAGIVRGHNGAIHVTSVPAKGSCFTVLFPAVNHHGTVVSAPRPHQEALNGKGTVLVVDDEEVIRELAKKVLKRYGYEVLEAHGGLAAIDVLKRHPGDISLVILDLSMPEMGGEEALSELRKIRPEVRVVVSSGYSEAEAMTLFEGRSVSGFVQKPYTAARLAQAVREYSAVPSTAPATQESGSI